MILPLMILASVLGQEVVSSLLSRVESESMEVFR